MDAVIERTPTGYHMIAQGETLGSENVKCNNPATQWGAKKVKESSKL